jgi:hypothetical protein
MPGSAFRQSGVALCSARQAPLMHAAVGSRTSDVIGLHVETRRRADAECIARALDMPLSRSPNGWQVTLEVVASRDIGRFLTALQSCLDEEAIPMVTVVLDDDRYVMEAARSET